MLWTVLSCFQATPILSSQSFFFGNTSYAINAALLQTQAQPPPSYERQKPYVIQKKKNKSYHIAEVNTNYMLSQVGITSHHYSEASSTNEKKTLKNMHTPPVTKLLFFLSSVLVTSVSPCHVLNFAYFVTHSFRKGLSLSAWF